MDRHQAYADKISKLLRKAESTSSQAEAESLFEKAQELMTKYAIDEAMLNLKAEKTEEIVRKTYVFSGIYRKPLFELGYFVGLENDCKVLVYDRSRSPQERHCILIGFESDVRNAMLLIQSLEIQALASMKAWWDETGSEMGFDKGSGKKARKEFIHGFALEIWRRLQAGRKSGIKQAETESGSESVALVLANKRDLVENWFADHYGGSVRRSRVGRNRSYGSFEAHAAGRQAGSKADIGGGRVGGNRKQLGD